MLPIGIVFGTRPEYLKVKSLFEKLRAAAIPFHILHVKQHLDLDIEEKNTSEYRYITLDSIYSLTRLNELASSLPKYLEPAIQECSSILVQGDTATAYFAALTAFHLKKPIFHLEAGLRTFDLANPFPEEAYRSMISRIATYHLCPDESAKQNLLNENIHKNIFVVGNTILDLVKSYGMTSKKGSVVPITIHRRENWDSLSEIVKEIHHLATKRPDLEFVWIYHPNPTIQTKVQSTIQQIGTPSNLRFEQPCLHRTLCQLIHDSYCMITDSGGIQEEASFVGKYCFVMRKTTERSSIPRDYIGIIESPTDLVSAFLSKEILLLPPCTVYGNGTASESIITIFNLNNGKSKL